MIFPATPSVVKDQLVTDAVRWRSTPQMPPQLPRFVLEVVDHRS
jgi:hypothetical protein